MLNTPGKQDGGFVLIVNGKAVINRADVLYRDESQERTRNPTPHCDPDPQTDDGLLGSLLGGLIEPDLQSKRGRMPLDSSTASGFVDTVLYHPSDANAHGDSPVRPGSDNDDLCDGSAEGTTRETSDEIGFQGLFFRHVP